MPLNSSAIVKELLFSNTNDGVIPGVTPASADALSYDPAITGALGKPLDVGLCQYLSLQCFWSGLDAADGAFYVYTSNDGLTWQEKFNSSGVAVALPTAVGSGHDMISFNGGVITEEFYAVFWDHGTNTAGTVKVIAVGK